MKLSLYFKDFDAWIGCFHDKKKKRLYIQLIPFFGMRIDYGD